MRAMVLESPAPVDQSPLRLADVADPRPAPGQVRLKVRCCAVCRTDLHILEGELPQQKRPLIPGHQVVGVVEALGEGCQRFQLGQRVGIAWLRSTCGACELCRSDRENLCAASQYCGYHADGGYAQYAVVPEDYAYEIPDGFGDLDVSPLLCAGIIGYRALNRANVPDGGRLMLVGFGSSAHIVMQLALHRGLEVFVATRGTQHQRMAASMGAAWVGDDPTKVPRRVHSAIVFAPAGGLLPPVLEALEKGGTVALAGIYMTAVPPLDYGRHLYDERDIRSVTANTRQDGRRLLAEAGAARVQTHITTYDLADANRALADMKHSRLDGSGVLVM